MKRFKRDWPVIFVRVLIIAYLTTLMFLVSYGVTRNTQLLYFALACGIMVLILSLILAILLGKEIRRYKNDGLDELRDLEE